MSPASSHLNTQAVLSMRGGGYYSARTLGAKQAIDQALPLVQAALVPQPGAEGILRIADFGAADGGTSREMWFHALTALRAGGDTRPVAITYTDLPSNDFSTLFRSAQGLHGDAAHAFQDRLADVFVYGCGTGFHRQIFPAASLDLGFSATAMHYLSEIPCTIAAHVHATGASVREAAAFAAQAKADWERILVARAHELRPGGRLICLNFGIDEQGRFLGNTGGQHMFDIFNRLWAARRDIGAITAAEYARATFVQYYRTLAEFTQPLLDADSRAYRAGLRLVDAHSRYTRCPFAADFAAAAGAMAAREFAQTLIPTLRSWSETVFLTALEGRPPDEAQAIVDGFYQEYEDLVAADPTGHAMDYIHIVLVVEKLSASP